MYKKIIIITALLNLIACEAEKTEIEIAENLFPYTWSHPECPFS